MRWALALLALLVAAGGGFAAGYAVRGDDDLRDERGRVIEATQVDVVDLQVGDCVRGVEGGESVAVEAVPCRSPHKGRGARAGAAARRALAGAQAGAGDGRAALRRKLLLRSLGGLLASR